MKKPRLMEAICNKIINKPLHLLIGGAALALIIDVIALLLLTPEPSHSAALIPDEEVSGIVKACAGGSFQQIEGDIEAKISLWKRGVEASGKGSIGDLGALLKTVPQNQQISPEIYKTYTDCIITAFSKYLSTEDTSSRLKSEIRELANFPNGPETSQPPTLLQTMYTNKLPHRLFDLLGRYNETQILSVGKNGDALYRYKGDYYSFQSKVVSWEDNLTTNIGQMVPVRFRQAWTIYLQYIIMRFGGLSKEEIIARGNFLNYNITWDDAERVFTELSKETSVAQSISEILTFQMQMSEDARKLTSDI